MREKIETRKTNSHFYKKLKLYGVLTVSVSVFSFTLSGCSSAQNYEEPVSIVSTEVAMDTVYLDEVSVPVYGDIFFMLSMTGEEKDLNCVSWGTGTDWVWDKSGFPGFGLPMIVSCHFAFPEDVSCMRIVTDYGEFQYEVVGVGEARVCDDKLLDARSLKEIVQFGIDEEVLVVFNSETKQYVYATLVCGTTIVLRA